MLSAPSQVLLRNISLFEQGHWAFVNPQDAHIFNELSNVDYVGLHQYFDTFSRASKGQQEKHQFAAEFKANDKLDGAVIYMPKAKQQAKMLLANLAPLIKPGGQLMVVGENKAGVKSVSKLMADYGSQVNKIDAARHCSLFCVQTGDSVKDFKLDDWLNWQKFAVNNQQVELATLPGVFSHGELDMGTHLLLSEVSPVEKGHVLDFACGCGVIGIFLAQQSPGLKVSMSDVNALALHCAELNSKKHGVDCDVIASDGLTNIDGKFDAIYSNPPFHTGVDTDYGITERFIRSAKNHLRERAKLVIVANRFLKYPDILEQTFGRFDVIGQTGKFTLYQAIR